MEKLEEILYSSTNLSNDIEECTVKLVTEIKLVATNNCSVDFSNVLLNLADLIECMELFSEQKRDETRVIKSLRCDVLYLENKLHSEKDRLKDEINMSFQLQDLAEADNKNLKLQIQNISKDLEKSRAALITLAADKNELLNKLSQIQDENENFRNLIRNLEEYKLNLVNEVQTLSSKSKVNSNNDRWLDDETIQSVIDPLIKHCNARNDILILGPSVSQLMKLADSSDANLLLDDLSIDNRKHVFGIVNNCGKGQTNSNGTHWSLLYIDNVKKVAYHFDSLKNHNIYHAKCLAQRFGISNDSVNYISCHQQNSTFECGYYTLMSLNLVLNAYVLPCVKLSFKKWYDSLRATLSENVHPSFSCGSINVNDINSTVSSQLVDGSSCEQNCYKSPIKLVFKKCKQNKWQVCKAKNGSSLFPPVTNVDIPLQNRFSLLDELEDCNPIPAHRESNDTELISNTKSSNINSHSKSYRNCHKFQMKVTSKCNKSQNIITNSASCKQRKIILLSDSHGRGLSERLNMKLPSDFHVSSFVMPSAPLEHVTKDTSTVQRICNENDFVIILAGTNNVPDNCSGISDFMAQKLAELDDTNTIVLSIPNRYDTTKFNQLIVKANRDLSDTVARFKRATFVSLHSLSRNSYTNHGLHLNGRGKDKLSKILLKCILNLNTKSYSSINNINCVEIEKENKYHSLPDDIAIERKPISVIRKKVWYNSSFVKEKNVNWRSQILRSQSKNSTSFVSSRIDEGQAVKSGVWTNSISKHNFLEIGPSRALVL